MKTNSQDGLISMIPSIIDISKLFLQNNTLICCFIANSERKKTPVFDH